MKNLNEIINEGFAMEFNIIQSDSNKGAAYSTVDTSEPKKKYKYGFLSYSQFNEAVFMVAFNKIEDLQDLLDTDDDEYSNLLSMKPQEYKVVDGELFVKLW